MNSSQIQQMFDSVAKHYDKMNKIMTFGTHKKWIRQAVSLLNINPGDSILDIATGTGDLIFEAVKQNDIDAFALDFSQEMLKIARKKDKANEIYWIEGDALELPFPDSRFDSVFSAYLLRNVSSIDRALLEQWRVLKKGGSLICIDTNPRSHILFRPFISLYLSLIIPFLGKIFAKNRNAYTYLTKSTKSFIAPEEIKLKLEIIGFKNITIRKFMFNTIALCKGTKV